LALQNLILALEVRGMHAFHYCCPELDSGFSGHMANHSALPEV